MVAIALAGAAAGCGSGETSSTAAAGQIDKAFQVRVDGAMIGYCIEMRGSDYVRQGHALIKADAALNELLARADADPETYRPLVESALSDLALCARDAEPEIRRLHEALAGP